MLLSSLTAIDFDVTYRITTDVFVSGSFVKMSSLPFCSSVIRFPARSSVPRILPNALYVSRTSLKFLTLVWITLKPMSISAEAAVDWTPS
jgi:hypothetical protein